MTIDKNILEMTGITKVYGTGVLANHDVNLSVREGEIHALMGENGAGKSTLMKILFGIERHDQGTISFSGKQVDIASANHAISIGIGMVHQHFKLVPSLTVAENIVLGMEPKNKLFFDTNKAKDITKNLCQMYNFDLNPEERIESLSVGKKQKVEILKTLYRNTKLLILDEPTAVLTPQETKELFEQLIKLKSNGITIIFISHKLNEIKQICDRITIMRAGKSVGTYDVGQLTEADISRLMVGRDVILKIDKTSAEPKATVLEVRHLSHFNDGGRRVLKNVSLRVREGEIVGIAGIEGSGQKELVELITGMQQHQKSRGSIHLCGEDVGPLSIKKIRQKGLSYIPEDRLTYGIAKDISIQENLFSSIFDSESIRSGLIYNKQKIERRVSSNITNFDIRCKSPQDSAAMLSGGNMQKIVIAREFSTEPKLLIADQPTRGVDVGAIEFIHKKIIAIRDRGCAVLLISADLNEILELSDSVIVMCQGEVAARFEDVKSLSEEMLGYYMLGLRKQTSEEIERVGNSENQSQH